MTKKSAVLFLIIAVIAAATAAFLFMPHGKSSAAADTKYCCPLHPSIIYDKPGTCPVCGMDLVATAGKKNSGSDGEEINEKRLQPDIENLQKDHGQGTGPSEINYAGGGSAPAPSDDSDIEKVPQDDSGNKSGDEGEIIIGNAPVEIDPKKEKEAGVRSKKAEEMDIKFIIDGNAQVPQKNQEMTLEVQIFKTDARFVKGSEKATAVNPVYPEKKYQCGLKTGPQPSESDERYSVVKAELYGADETLPPGTNLDIKIEINRGRQLAIPNEAIFDTGEKLVVFVRVKPGRYEPRNVSLGAVTETCSEVLSGVKEGEEVVTSASFLTAAQEKSQVKKAEASGDADGPVNTGE